MGEVNSTVILNQIAINALAEAAVQALEMTAEAVHTDVVQAQVIPRDSGVLQGPGTGTSGDDEGTNVDKSESAQGTVSIVSNTPYARRLYYHPEYNFSTVENPNARGNWFEPWLTGDKKDFAQDKFEKLYKQLTGV